MSNKAFRLVIDEYVKKTTDWRAAYRKIPAYLREIYVNAYQSFLWNEYVKEVLRTTVEKKRLYAVESAVVPLLFNTRLTERERERIPLTFQTISEQMTPADDERQVVGGVLAKEVLRLADFRIEAETGNFCTTRARQVLLSPKDFTISKPQRDETNSKGIRGRYKIQVSFSLLKGIYATVVTKQLFGH